MKRKFREMDVKYTLAYPATLRFKWIGKNVSFIEATAAKTIINNDRDEHWTSNEEDYLKYIGIKIRHAMLGGLHLAIKQIRVTYKKRGK